MNTPRWKYSSYPPSPIQEEIQRLSQEMQVRSVTAIEWYCAPSWSIPPRRIGDDMFFLIIKGKGEAIVENQRIVLKPGACAHFRRGMLHEASHDPRHPIRVIALHYSATFFKSLTVPEALQFPSFFQLGMRSPILKMMQEACRAYALKPPGWERRLEAAVTPILFYLMDHHGREMKLHPGSLHFTELRRILPALEGLRGRLAEPEPISLLAERCGFSEVQFRRVFHRVMGISPVQHLRRIRMEEACRLLRQTGETIESIASRVGYGEPAFFAHTFRRLMGVPPGEYRRIGL